MVVVVVAWCSVFFLEEDNMLYHNNGPKEEFIKGQ
jgi:hypothetical protein